MQPHCGAGQTTGGRTAEISVRSSRLLSVEYRRQIVLLSNRVLRLRHADKERHQCKFPIPWALCYEHLGSIGHALVISSAPDTVVPRA